MRALRLMTALGLSIGVCAFIAPGASACQLQSFGPGPGAGTVGPGDPVPFTAHAIGTDESPGASPWEIDVGGIVVASGTAVPDAGHEWTGSGTFQMPSLGAKKSSMTITIRFTDSGMSSQFSVLYDGTPASTGQQPIPVSHPAPPPAPGTPPATSSPPVSAPGHAPTSGATPAKRTTPRPRPQHVARAHAPSPHRPAPAPAVHMARPAFTAVTGTSTARVMAPVVPIAVARTEPAQVRARHAPVATRHRLPARRATPAMPRGVATEPVVVRSRPAAARAARADGNSPTVSYAAGALLLALLLGGGGLAAAIARRRRDVPEPPTDRFAEMEAELQEILAEEKLRADKEARAREPA